MKFLKEHLGEELYNQVVEKLKGNEDVKLANLSEGGYVSKDKFLAVEKSANDLTGELTQRDKDLAKLNKSIATGAVDSDQFKADIEAMQAKHKLASEGFESDLLLSEAKLAILDYGGIDPVSIIAHLDMAKVTRVEGKLAGLTEQLDPIKEPLGHLFGEPKKIFKSAPPNPPPPSNDGNTEWEQKFAKAKKSGTTLDVITVKQAAFEAGVVLN